VKRENLQQVFFSGSIWQRLAQARAISLIYNGFNFAAEIIEPPKRAFSKSELTHKSAHGSGWILMFIRTWQGMF
jgi:hypothetical protein